VIPLKIKGTTDAAQRYLDEEGLSKQLGDGLKREIRKAFSGAKV